MAKWYGMIGFSAGITETEPGIYEDPIIEKPYYGDTIQNLRKLQNSGDINDDVVAACDISIVADPYANQNFYSIRYAELMGAKWKVTSVNPQYPRLILNLGGLYNGN